MTRLISFRTMQLLITTAIIDYNKEPPLTKGERKAKAKQLREYALHRGWQYQA